MLLEQFIIYGIVGLLCFGVIYAYLRKERNISKATEAKIEKAIQEDTFEPVSLHPVIDLGTCIKSGACVDALGISVESVWRSRHHLKKKIGMLEDPNFDSWVRGFA